MTSYQKEFEESKKSPYFKAMSVILDVVYNVSRLMKQKNISKKELAKKMNVSPAYITKIMKGEQNLSMETIAKIAVALDCELTAPVIYDTISCDILYDSSTIEVEKENNTYKIRRIANIQNFISDNYVPFERQTKC